MALFTTRYNHASHRPLVLRLRLFFAHNAHYRLAGPFIYLGGAAGTALYAALGLGTPQLGLLIGTIGAYIIAALVYASCPCAHSGHVVATGFEPRRGQDECGVGEIAHNGTGKVLHRSPA